MEIAIVQLGRIDYATGLCIQQQLVARRKNGEIEDTLLLLEHTPVITMGRNARAANVLVSPDLLALRGVEMFECDRGGDVTFHGPGQVVGYPIFDLRAFDTSNLPQLELPETRSEAPITQRKTLGAVGYVRRLEEVLIRTCAEFGIAAERVAGLTGVWTSVDPETGHTRPANVQGKIAAIGVHISRGVTSHGFALNVNTDLEYFNLIVPCGIATKPVTSIEKELGREVDPQLVREAIERSFREAFGRETVRHSLESLLGNAVGVPMNLPRELRELHPQKESFFA